jgi:hypothetical protein
MHTDPQKLLSFGQSRDFRTRSTGTAHVVALVVAYAIGCGFLGCDDTTKTTQRKAMPRTEAASASGNLDLMDPADDVMSDPPTSAKQVASKSASGATAASTNASSKGRWSVMLATFSQPDHLARANAYRVELMREYPELAQAMVRRVGNGSAIVVGRFEGPDDKGAQVELKRVKTMERNGRKPFAGAMLLRTSTDDAPAAIKPYDLRNLRAKFPKVRPLFTLQVAAWSTFSDKSLKYDDMRKAAESYCAQLRSKGNDAWFHHDEDSETSIVTVGNFDRRAYDSKSTLFSPEVEDLMRQFPAHLLNGEPALIPVDSSKPNGKTKPQGCRLVEVPEA